jgi:hypothetical protein
MADPEPFDGKAKNIESFINSCVNIFEAQPSQFTDNAARCRFALGFMKGDSAIRWRDLLFKELKEGTYVFSTWDEFEQRLRTNFGDPLRSAEAQRQISRIKQGSRTAQEFFIDFENLRAESGFNDAGVVFALKNALRPAVRDEASRRLPTPLNGLPASYEFWKTVVLQVDHDLRANAADNAFFTGDPYGPRQYTPGYAPRNTGSSSTTAPTATSTNNAPAATTTATANTTSRAANQVARALRCWNCGGTGHISKDCKTERKERTRAVLEGMDNVELLMENIRHMIEEANDDGSTGDDSEVFTRLTTELPQFFVDADE